jgi:hypothetical protein
LEIKFSAGLVNPAKTYSLQNTGLNYELKFFIDSLAASQLPLKLFSRFQIAGKRVINSLAILLTAFSAGRQGDFKMPSFLHTDVADQFLKTH